MTQIYKFSFSYPMNESLSNKKFLVSIIDITVMLEEMNHPRHKLLISFIGK